MGTVIFLVAAAIEIALAIFCITTKSGQKTLKSVIRIGSFLAFLFLIITPVLDWGLRYYALAVFLFLLAVIGAVGLLRRKDEKTDPSPARAVLKAVGMTALFFVISLPAIVFPQHAPLKTTGTYAVATAAFTYTDESRIEIYTEKNEKRKLNVEFWYPENYNKSAPNSCPLVVFSHGSLGVRTSNESLYNELASHGYVVCAIDHTYQCFYTADENGHITLIDANYMRELQAENAKDDRLHSWELYEKWMEIRTGDINFVIDDILNQSQDESTETVIRLIDSGKIGVIGHSLGGSAALGIGRLRDDVSAVIALEAPLMYDIEGVENGEFVWNDEAYPVPVLNIYSDASWSHLDEWPQYAANNALLTDTAVEAFNVYIKGAGHLNLTDLALTSPLLTSILNGGASAADSRYCLETVNQICLEFFDAYLRGTGEFHAAGTY